MSVTHPDATFTPAPQHGFAEKHPQLAPFLLAMTILAVAAVVALSLTGLPS
jgi:hypothetical protein